MSVERPRGTLVQNYWLPVIRSLGDLHRRDAGAAIESLRPTESYELSDTRLPLLLAFIRGEAYLLAQDGRRAAAEFQKLLEHHGAVGNSVLGPLARLALGRAMALAGGTAGAPRPSTSRSSNCGATPMQTFPCCVRPERSIAHSDPKRLGSWPSRPRDAGVGDGASGHNLPTISRTGTTGVLARRDVA